MRWDGRRGESVEGEREKKRRKGRKGVKRWAVSQGESNKWMILNTSILCSTAEHSTAQCSSAPNTLYIPV